MKKHFLKALSLIIAVSMVCSCTAQESISSSAPEISSAPETTSTSATSGNDETSEPETEDISKDETTTTEITTYDIPETTTTETTIPPETEASTPVPETTSPVPLWTETEVNKTMYVTVGCYSRKEAIQGAETVSLYNINDKVKIIAETNTEYCKLENGAFIHKDYLSNNKVVITTTTAATTPKPAETKPVSTTPATTTTEVQTSPVETPPVEYSTRTEEIKAYYHIELTEETKLTKSNSNNFQSFVSVATDFYYDSATSGLCFHRYYVDYNLDKNIYEYESYKTSSYLEKIILLTLLNENQLTDESLKQILKPFSREELEGITTSIVVIMIFDIINERYYDYSKIVIDKDLATLLTNTQEAFKKKDYSTLEKLCNENFGKYNSMVDALILAYAHASLGVNKFPTNEHQVELAPKSIKPIYDRLYN